MGRSRVVKPEIVRLALSDGDWIDVKRELNAGEYQGFIESVSMPREFGEKPLVNQGAVGPNRLLLYLVGWSFTGIDDAPLPYDASMPANLRIDTIRSLDADTFSEMITALDAHEVQVTREKKERGVAIASART